jgi:hypothetical protein
MLNISSQPPKWAASEWSAYVNDISAPPAVIDILSRMKLGVSYFTKERG